MRLSGPHLDDVTIVRRGHAERSTPAKLSGPLRLPPLDVGQRYGVRDDLASQPGLLGVSAKVIAMRKILAPTFFGKSCASCVAVVYLVLLGLILWLIFDAELPLIAMQWNW